METKSFTFRIPLDVLERIEERAGDRKRSEYIIRLLREALGMQPEFENSATSNLEAQIASLNYQIEILKTMQDNVIHRLALLEDSLRPKEEMQQEERPILQSKTEQDAENLLLLPEENEEIPVEAQKISSPKLLSILRQEEPKRGWNSGKLRYSREGKKKKIWNQVGNCKYKYAGEEQRNNRPEHEWWTIHPSLTAEVQTKQDF